MKPAGGRSGVRRAWLDAGLEADALRALTLEEERANLPSSFAVAEAAESSIALAALAAATLGHTRGGPLPEVRVPRRAAEFECSGHFTVDGAAPSAWAPLSGVYACREGYVRIHANFDHHRDGALAVLGLRGEPADIGRDRVQAALLDWHALEFERACASRGLVVAAARDFAEWDRHPQAHALRAQPLVGLSRIDDAPPLPLPPPTEDSGPLSRLRVLDLTRILAGPICTRTLAAYGADVLLVNSPRLPNIPHIADTSRGKLSAWLDLDHPQGSRRLTALIQDAHVFVQSYRPGGLEARGFGPARLARLRPGIVYVSLSAYGHGGPWADRRGFDSLVQMATGINQAEAEAAGSRWPRPLPVQILDFASGFLMAFGACAALLRQREEGGSWHVQVSLARTAHWLRSLGRVDRLHIDQPDFEPALEEYASGFGALRAIPHAARLGGQRCVFARASMPPGSHPPQWP